MFVNCKENEGSFLYRQIATSYTKKYAILILSNKKRIEREKKERAALRQGKIP